MIESQGWKPLGVCSACSAETSLLSWTVIIKQIKSRALLWQRKRETEKQVFSTMKIKQPLHSSGGLLYTKYMKENRNLDICVSG